MNDIRNYSAALATKFGIDVACIVEAMREEIWQLRRHGSNPEIKRSISDWIRIHPWITRYRLELVFDALKSMGLITISNKGRRMVIHYDTKVEKLLYDG